MAKHLVRHQERQNPVIVQADEAGCYWVSCPSFVGCYSQGETIEEALENIKEAIGLCRDEKQHRAQPIRSDVSLHFVQI